jgi:hypothetical protein
MLYIKEVDIGQKQERCRGSRKPSNKRWLGRVDRCSNLAYILCVATFSLEMNEWAQKNWKIIAAFAAGALLGAIGVRQGYEGFSLDGSQYILIKKASIPKSLTVNGRWFYQTETSDADLDYKQYSCKSILGVADISQGQQGEAVSNEFSIDNATRKACITSNGESQKVNVAWNSKIASVLPGSRRILVSLITADPNPRFGYIEGSIPSTDSGNSPSEFSGSMYYLNTNDQTYGRTTIKFCKEGSDCARSIEKKF